jgi:hypothetical protein
MFEKFKLDFFMNFLSAPTSSSEIHAVRAAFHQILKSGEF